MKTKKSELNTKLHGLSIDVEDWFHVLEWEHFNSPSLWKNLESRVTSNTNYCLNLFEHYNIKATFFILGWVAENYPDLVRKIVDKGHEIGSHGHVHNLVSHMNYDEFAKDLDASLAAISSAANQDVKAYRAPGFSITPDQFWAFEILASRGITLDSSLFIGKHSHGGLFLERKQPFEIILSNGRKLIEAPITSYPILNWRIPFSGGGYLRLLPTLIVKQLFQLSERRNMTVVTYAHPREFDLNPPKLKLDPIRQFKYYVGTKTFRFKFKNILKSYNFGTVSNLVYRSSLDKPLFIDCHRLLRVNKE